MTDLRPHIKAHGTAGVVQRDGRKPLFVFVDQDGEIWGLAANGNHHHWQNNGMARHGYNAPDLLPVEPPAAGEPVAWIVSWKFNPRPSSINGGGGSAIYREAAEKDARVSHLRASGRVETLIVEPLYTAPAGDELVAVLTRADELIRRDHLMPPTDDDVVEWWNDPDADEASKAIRALLAKHGAAA